jgi:hypothetical protein
VIEKQSRVEIVPKIHFECQTALSHFHELVPLVEASVLLAAFAAPARFDGDALARNFQHLASRTREFAQARAREILVDRRRRLIFLDVQAIAVDVDRGGVFGKVRIINAPAFDPFALRAFVQMTEILVDAVFHHLAAGR